MPEKFEKGKDHKKNKERKSRKIDKAEDSGYEDKKNEAKKAGGGRKTLKK